MSRAYLKSIDLIGELASPLAGQTIVVRVNGIDEAKLRRAVAGDDRWRGALTSSALSLAARVPTAALDLSLPVAARLLQSEYGIDATLTRGPAPPMQGSSELWLGLGLGLGLAGVGWGLLQLVRRPRR